MGREAVSGTNRHPVELPRRRRKIAFYGLFGQQNLGNECTLQAILRKTSENLPDADLYCICTDPDDTEKRHNVRAFPIKGIPGKARATGESRFRRLFRKLFHRIPNELLHWVKAYRILKGTQMLIAPGTGLLTDYATSPFSRPYDVFKWSMIAKLCRCKLLFVSVGAAAMHHPISRIFFKSALSLADYRSYRDLYTRRYLKSIGFVSDRDPVYPDLAFSLEQSMLREHEHRGGKWRIIGVGLKDYYGQLGVRQDVGDAIYRDYLEKLCTFVVWLLEQGYTVRILMGDPLYDRPVKDDLMASLESRGIDWKDGRILDEPVYTVEDLLSQIATTDMVVSPRFHNILLALMLNKPAIALAYQEKFESLMGDLGLSEYCQHIDRLDVERLKGQFIEFKAKSVTILSSVQRKTQEYRMSLEEQYANIFNGNGFHQRQ